MWTNGLQGILAEVIVTRDTSAEQRVKACRTEPIRRARSPG